MQLTPSLCNSLSQRSKSLVLLCVIQSSWVVLKSSITNHFTLIFPSQFIFLSQTFYLASNYFDQNTYADVNRWNSWLFGSSLELIQISRICQKWSEIQLLQVPPLTLIAVLLTYLEGYFIPLTLPNIFISSFFQIITL